MKLIGLMAVRNEAWVLALSARVALTWCDELVIRGHACTDGTFEIVKGLIAEYAERVRWLYDDSEAWAEMDHRQNMLNTARLRGATHIAMIDADEILTGNLIREYHVKNLAMGTRMLTLPLYNLRGGIERYHANGLWGNRVVSVAFADSPELHWGGDRFHSREPQGKRLHSFSPVTQGEGGILHLWGVSERRLIAKHALYKITERLRWPDKDVRQIDFMYSQCVKGGLREDPKTWTYSQVPLEWWLPYQRWMHYLDVDAEPWQTAECQRLVAEHGREKFQGLDLFGVA